MQTIQKTSTRRSKLKTHSRLSIAFLLFSLSLLIGCSQIRFPAAFRIDVAQGNILDREKVEQLRPGMTQRQVLYLLGSPVMQNAFEPSTWRYIYQFSKEGGAPKRYELTLQFEDDVLQSIDGDLDAIKAWHKLAETS